jgi:2-oxoglutarate dehydrogenase complex dehydrogenase (E1) component-like enzyme
MQQTQADPLVDALVKDFGGNYVFALDILEQYRANPQSVDASWRQYFDRLLGVAPKAEPAPGPAEPSSASHPPTMVAAGCMNRPRPSRATRARP